MKRLRNRKRRLLAIPGAALLLLHAAIPQTASAYVLNMVVADMRESSSTSGGTSCPRPTRFDVSVPGTIAVEWSTSLGTNPATILTDNQDSDDQADEIEGTIIESLASWTNAPGSALTPDSIAPITRTSTQNACSVDGQNTVCFNQSDPAFTAGVLAFTRVTTADAIGERVSPTSSPSTFIGEILDADILLRPSDPAVAFTTADDILASNPASYDLESILTHELGHLLGLGHSAVWRAVMFPFVPAPGTFLGRRQQSETDDAPLAADDETAMRVLYPNPSDQSDIGSIAGRVLPANILALSAEPAGTTGIFAAQVVAVDVATGAVIAASVSGWSCTDPGPPIFDGSYTIAQLPVGSGRTYQVYAEPLAGLLNPAEIVGESTTCRNALSDPGWPSQFACATPSPINNFSVGVRAGP